MCGKLIYIVLAQLGLLVIDNFYPLFASVICGLFIYFYIRIFSSDFKKHHLIASLIIKIWGGVSFIFMFWKFIILLFRNLFSSKKSSRKSNSSEWEHCGDQLCLEKEIDVILFKISKHYLHSWYDNVSHDEEFLLNLNTLIKCTLLRLCSKITKVNRWKVFYLALQIYLHFFIHFVDGKKRTKLRPDKFEMKHWALQDKMTEWCYLQSLISSLIDNIVPVSHRNSVHSKHSPIIHNFVVEILTEHILYPLSNLLSDPSQLNAWILKIFETYTKNNCDYYDLDNLECQNSILESVPSNDSNAGPKIILEPEDNMNDVQTINQRRLSERRIEVRKVNDSFINETKDVISHKRQLKEKNSDSLSPFMSPNIKSSSNLNLFDKDLLNSRASKSEVCSPVSSDASTIKRSKSADYIRQIPHLRALSVRDYNSLLKSKDNKMFLTIKTDSTSDCSIEQAEEAVELPTLFSDVRICDTIQENEGGVDPYTLYCIKYLGIFHDVDQSTKKPNFIQQEVSLKRRFSEFLALQSRLEDNQSLKNSLKGIKKPTKWVALPFSNMDKKNIAERKAFLENYLKELCNKVPIVQSAELQEFLAYGGDATGTFGKKAADISVPRIDKIFVRGVKGAIDMFKTALPNSVEGGCTSDSSVKPFPEDPNVDHWFPEHLLEYSVRETELRIYLKDYFRDSSSTFRNSPMELSRSDKIPERASILRNILKLKIENACQCSETWLFNDENFESEENPFGNSIVDLLIESLKYREINNSHLFSALKFLVSPSINRYCITMLEGLTEENLALFLHILHKALWSSEDTDDCTVRDRPKYSCNYDRLKQNLKVFISMNVTMYFSFLQNWIEEHILFFLSTIQHQELNKCLLFHLFDMVVEEMCSGNS